MDAEGQPQLGLPGLGYENRSLFSSNFLEQRLPEWSDFQALDVAAAADQLNEIWSREAATIRNANEAQTEDRLIQPILDVLGFERTVQASSRLSSGRRIPDYALFVSHEDRQASEASHGLERFESAVALAEAKKFATALDKRGAGAGPTEDPEAQILDYMWRTRVKWAILTNGREWRLYGQAGDLVEAAHLSIPDLPALIESRDLNQLRYFAAFFSAGAFTPDSSGRSFLDRAFAESEAHARRVGESLRDQVFEAVPLIASGLLRETERDDNDLEQAFSNALVILYRLLFCLYAESRRLLPVDNPSYEYYGLGRQRERVAEASGGASARSHQIFNDLEILFQLVNEGDDDLGINQYNGGLFSEDAHTWLAGRSVPDPLMRRALSALYAVDGENIDYRDLSIRHLGTMYEQLLARRLELDDGSLVLGGAEGRHDTGSYFTPEPIVDAIVEKTLEPRLLSRSQQVRGEGLAGPEAVERFLEITVCDPAMGSGHFLVSAASYISRFIATDPSQEGIDVDELRIRRSVSERCLYGVDVNPMAVELARLALWLATVDGSRPLAFLSNLRTGNSLVGADLDDLRLDIGYAERLTRTVGEMVERDMELQSIDSDSAGEVHEKQEIAAESAGLRHELEDFAYQTIRPWFPAGIEHVFHWEIEYPEVFFDADGAPGPGNGFDAIVGNPPYLKIQSLDRQLAGFCRNRYVAAHGSFDMYLIFIERSFGLLSSVGRLGFIVPNKFMKLDSASRLRGMLAEGKVVEEVVDFGDGQIFEGATNYTCIMVLDAGAPESVRYTRVPNRGVLPLPADIDRAPVETYDATGLGADPWILVPARERSILATAAESSSSLEEVTQQVFQGLITSADPVYIVRDLGPASGGRRVYSKELDEIVTIERDLLHPLASGTDVDRWAFRPLDYLLLFPYKRDGESMRLLTPEELDRLPATRDYLTRNEERLRGRETGKMDHDNWFGYVYPKSLGNHDLPKLGVPRLCERLRAAVDPEGVVYLDNVDVNGILPSSGGLTPHQLAALLNSRLLDFIFRIGSVPFRGAFYSANKQFVAPLPIRVPEGETATRLEGLAAGLWRSTRERNSETRGFREWLSGLTETPLRELRGHTALNTYETLSAEDILALLRRNRGQIGPNPDSRAFAEQLRTEFDASLERLQPLDSAVAAMEAEVEEVVFDLYGMSSSQRATINAEYED
jgi:hypothetical protein